jgi:hypothetical protein
MKKIIYFMILGIFIFNESESQIKMNSSGSVIIGNSTANPATTLDIRGWAQFITDANWGAGIRIEAYYGIGILDPYTANAGVLGYYRTWDKLYANDIWVTNDYHYSDSKMKENISKINNPLQNLLKLNGVKYDFKESYYKTDSSRNKFCSLKLTNEYGFLAQEVQKVLPDVVVYDSSRDAYGIMYTNLIPVIIEAMKEQQAQIDSLKQIIKKNSSTLKSAEINTGIDELNGQNETPVLEQNVPNPFSVETNINFYIPQNAKSAALYIYNLQGTQMKAYSISSRGKSFVGINGSELLPGMYLYTLIVDGKEVNTLKMILTE